VLPSGTKAELAALLITIVPGFPTSLARGVDQNGNPAPIAFPFGIWFANAETLHDCDEGDGTLVTPAVNGNVADAATIAAAGVQKWSLASGTWHLDYILQNGPNILSALLAFLCLPLPTAEVSRANRKLSNMPG
jgi:hypothetical protein